MAVSPDGYNLVVHDDYIEVHGVFTQKTEMAIVPGVYTFSVLYENGTLDTITGTVPEASYFVGNMNGANVQFGAAGSKNFILVNYGGKNVSLKAVKFECGDQQTLAHQEGGKWVLNEVPDYKEELAKCQAYQLEIRPKNYTGYIVPGRASASNVKQAYVDIPTPVTMVKNPAITYSGGFVLSKNGLYASGVHVTGFYFDSLNAGSVSIIAYTDGGLTAEGVYRLVGYKGDSRLLFNANL